MDSETFNFLEKILTEVQGVKQELQEVKNEVKQNSNHILKLETKLDTFQEQFNELEFKIVTESKLERIK